MDAFGPDKLAVLALCAWGGVGAAPSAAQEAEPADIVVFFEDYSYDGATGRTEMTGLSISQGELSVKADRGTEIELDDDEAGTERSEWRLEGSVEIQGDGVRITGDTAQFLTRNGRLERFELRGSPAKFEDLEPGGSGQAFGEAEQLLYDAVEGVVSLNGEARVVLGANEYLGCDLIYDIDAKASRSGSSQCDRPLQMIRISPSEDAADRQAP